MQKSEHCSRRSNPLSRAWLIFFLTLTGLQNVANTDGGLPRPNLGQTLVHTVEFLTLAGGWQFQCVLDGAIC